VLFSRSTLKVSMKHQHVLYWGGLRGAPPEIVTVTFTVVAFSVIVQGLTMTPLLGRVGEIPGLQGQNLQHE
jgi:CPA1 family monovalent cation:H+ antiporter